MQELLPRLGFPCSYDLTKYKPRETLIVQLLFIESERGQWRRHGDQHGPWTPNTIDFLLFFMNIAYFEMLALTAPLINLQN